MLAIERGLEEARSLDLGEDGNAGRLRLGFDASMSGWDTGYAVASLDYSQRIADTPLGELSAFGRGFGGVSMTPSGVRPNFGLTGGLEMVW